MPTRLAPRKTSILCNKTLNFIKKRRKYIQEEGGLGQNPKKKNKRQKREQATKDYGNL